MHTEIDRQTDTYIDKQTTGPADGQQARNCDSHCMYCILFDEDNDKEWVIWYVLSPLFFESVKQPKIPPKPSANVSSDAIRNHVVKKSWCQPTCVCYLCLCDRLSHLLSQGAVSFAHTHSNAAAYTHTHMHTHTQTRRHIHTYTCTHVTHTLIFKQTDRWTNRQADRLTPLLCMKVSLTSLHFAYCCSPLGPWLGMSAWRLLLSCAHTLLLDLPTPPYIR